MKIVCTIIIQPISVNLYITSKCMIKYWVSTGSFSLSVNGRFIYFILGSFVLLDFILSYFIPQI